MDFALLILALFIAFVAWAAYEAGFDRGWEERDRHRRGLPTSRSPFRRSG